MASIVIADEKLLGFATAFSDERLREVMFCLQDGPATEAVIQEFMKLEAKDLTDRLGRLHELGLIRKTSVRSDAHGIYSLDFSMEQFNGYPKRKTVSELSEAMGKPITPFLQGHAEEIESICQGNGISLGRAIEQLLLSAFSELMEDYGKEIAEEDRILCQKISEGGRAKKEKK
jgi:DNA-binding Lrp family transcriptional regulator